MTGREIWRDAARLRRAPLPTTPPSGPIDAVVGYLLARAAPFDPATQSALRRQRGWGLDLPAPITEVRTSARWQAVPALHRLAGATAPPGSLVPALDRLAELAPCWSAEAVADLLTHGLLAAPMHPAGVLHLARLYGLTPLVEVVVSGRRSAVWPLATKASRRRATASLVSWVSRAGLICFDPEGWAECHGVGVREVELAVATEGRLGCAGPVVWRVSDRTSALAGWVFRMLATARGPLTAASLADGAARAWRYDRARYKPGSTELMHWADAQPWLTRNGQQLAFAPDAGSAPVRVGSAPAHAILERALRAARENTLKLDALLAELVAAGYSRAGAMYAVATAPILVQPRHGCYALRLV